MKYLTKKVNSTPTRKKTGMYDLVYKEDCTPLPDTSEALRALYEIDSEMGGVFSREIDIIEKALKGDGV